MLFPEPIEIDNPEVRKNMTIIANERLSCPFGPSRTELSAIGSSLWLRRNDCSLDAIQRSRTHVPNHPCWLRAESFLPDALLILSGSDDGTLKLRAVKSARVV